MAYIALYRKYRPQTFEEIVGQEHITKILKNQIISGKIAHAYIFSGTRGTGKTSAAKVFARAINCLNPQNGEPCNECEACKAILEGNTTDIIEMDAASNNSVENIRSIRQEVAYSTTGLKYKVYIIDEAHMLSTSAFNALLKTLEEPPENVVFILATTEEHKIIPTILSRCIRFEFKKLSKEDIKKRIYTVLSDLNIESDNEVAEFVAKLADGGMRDALSILERCISSSDGKITKENVENIMGMVPLAKIEEIVNAILEYNVTKVEEITEDFLNSGKDLRNITSNITQEFLNLVITIAGNNYEGLSENRKEIIKRVSLTRVHEIIKHLSRLDDDLRQTNNSNVIFKAKMLELAISVDSLDENKLLQRINELEMKIERLEKEGISVKNISETKVEKKQISEKEETKKVSKSSKEKCKDLDKIMNKAVASDNLKLYSALTGVNAYFDNNDTLVFSTANSFAYGVLNKENTKNDLKKIVDEELNSNYNIKIEYEQEEKKEKKPNEFEDFLKDSGVSYEIVD